MTVLLPPRESRGLFVADDGCRFGSMVVNPLKRLMGGCDVGPGQALLKVVGGSNFIGADWATSKETTQ